MCVCMCFCLSKPFPTSLPLPLQPLSREVEARCTQTHPDAFNLSKWVTSVHMFRFLARTKGKRLAFYLGEKLGLLTLDPKASRGYLESLQACQCPRFWLSIGPERAPTTAGLCGCYQQHQLPWGCGCPSPSCGTRDVVRGQVGRDATGQQASCPRGWRAGSRRAGSWRASAALGEGWTAHPGGALGSKI